MFVTVIIMASSLSIHLAVSGDLSAILFQMRSR